MKIMITGGSGFIGKNLVEILSRNYEIQIPSRQELDLVDDAAVRNFFKGHTFDVVIHSAVKPGHRNAQDPSHQLSTNTRMFFNIMRNSNLFGKMIFLGSGAVYDTRIPLVKVKEDFFDSHVPSDEHGFSKYIAAKYVERMENVVKLRLFGIFGKYEDYTIRFISNAICKTLFDMPITIRQNRRFDYLYVDDLMPIIDYFINNKGRFVAYNVTPDNSVDLCSIAELVRIRSGKNLPILVREQGMGSEYSGDNSRLREEIPNIVLTPLHEAIDRLYGWYEANINLIEKSKLLLDK
jgi:nucleoside-diphosphate-sugar epimerase